ncbi:hypothetical protein GPK86_18215 [Blautia faecis]|uniref:hypothetical protein n=1 Tax=Blautia faecis TaxID=871665 RepID=UPI001C01BFF4|nr:hypothetical protein [Blautia faecis]MBT9858289.1 hypothetical protein [Blautia faecis]
MAQIKIFQSETYPSEIQKVRECILDFSESTKKELIETEYLNDYASSKLWDANSDFGRVHNKLMTVLENHSIIAYHNTRLAKPSKIMCNGLIFSDERYIDSLREDMQQQNVQQEMIGDIISRVIKERDRWEHNGVNRRKNEICFIFDMDYYKDYDKFLATYGGEFLEFALESIKHNGNLKKYREIIKLGKPYVVEFTIPFSKIDRFQKQDIARYMLEEWIHLDIRKDEVAHQYDGRIEFEIPAENIIKLHDVEDYFPDMDKWLFDET